MSKKLIILFIIAIFIGGGVIYVLTYREYEFVQVSDSLVWNDDFTYNYTIHVEVKNNKNTANSLIVSCELTLYDLSTITKNQTINFSKIGDNEIVNFSFSYEEIKEQSPVEYRIFGSRS